MTKAAREPQARRCPQARGGSLSPGCSSYLRRKLPQRNGEQCLQAAPPQPLALGRPGCTSCPGLRGAAQCLKDTDLRRGPPTCGKGPGKWGDPGHIAAERTSEMTLPPSSARSLLLMVTGELQLAPQISFALSAAPTTDTWAPEGSCPALSIHSSRGSVQWEALPFLAPSLQTREKPKGPMSFSESTRVRLHWHEKYCTC